MRHPYAQNPPGDQVFRQDSRSPRGYACSFKSCPTVEPSFELGSADGDVAAAVPGEEPSARVRLVGEYCSIASDKRVKPHRALFIGSSNQRTGSGKNGDSAISTILSGELRRFLHVV